MNKSHKLFIIIKIIGLIIVINSLVSCKIKLDPPTGLNVLDHQLIWNPVDKATGYMIKIDDQTPVEVETNSYDLSELTEIRNYQLTVMAVRGTITSEWSNPYTYKVRGEVTINQTIGGQITGMGIYEPGDIVNLVAIPDYGYRFQGWYQMDQLLSTDQCFDYQMTNHIINISAVFESIIVSFDPKTTFDGGKGSIDDPYLIRTKEQLAKLSQLVNTTKLYSDQLYFKLIANIDYQGYQLIPIGHSSDYNYDYAFRGNFDGNGYTISNFRLIQNYQTNESFGLFGYLYHGTVSNLEIDLVTVKTTTYENFYLGLIAAQNDNGVITNCQVTANLDISTNQSFQYIGGIVGINQGEIKQCRAELSILVSNQGESSYLYVGGISGDNFGLINNSYAIGEITCYASTLIFSGGITGNSLQGEIINCYSDLKLANYCNAWIRTGGIVGAGVQTKISGCLVFGDILSIAQSYSTAGLIIGLSNNCQLINCYFLSTIVIIREEGLNPQSPSNNLGISKEAYHFIDLEFYFNQLQWDPFIWDFDCLKQGVFPPNHKK